MAVIAGTIAVLTVLFLAAFTVGRPVVRVVVGDRREGERRMCEKAQDDAVRSWCPVPPRLVRQLRDAYLADLSMHVWDFEESLDGAIERWTSPFDALEDVDLTLMSGSADVLASGGVGDQDRLKFAGLDAPDPA